METIRSCLHLAITETDEYAAAKYVPKPYSGPVVIFEPKVPFMGQNDPRFGWGDVVPDSLFVCNLPIFPSHAC